MSAADVRRLVAGTAVASGATVVARRRIVDPAEHAVFRSINDLPNALHPPVYVLMQAGSLGAVFAVAGVAKIAGKNRLAAASAVAGTAVWGGCKIVKRWVGRGRPAAHVAAVTIRGTEERGLGFPSGHAAVRDHVDDDRCARASSGRATAAPRGSGNRRHRPYLCGRAPARRCRRRHGRRARGGIRNAPAHVSPCGMQKATIAES